MVAGSSVLGEDTAVERGAGVEDGLGLNQENALEVRGRSGIDISGHLPHHVGRAVAGAAVRDDIVGGLEGELVAAGALGVDAGVELDVGVALVHARREGRPRDKTGLDAAVGVM